MSGDDFWFLKVIFFLILAASLAMESYIRGKKRVGQFLIYTRRS